jgi:L-amino acid N-acyltransferase YncA
MTESTARARLRDATAEDTPEIARIYAHYVETTCISFEEVAPSAHEMGARLRRLRQSGLPWRVALGESGAVIGYAYASPFRARSAYRYTVENSVYLAPDQVRRGAGTALMRELIRDCAALGYRQMMAVIADDANEGSLKLHARLGFQMIGKELAVGFKFGRWVDVVQMQLALGEGNRSVPGADPTGYAAG